MAWVSVICGRTIGFGIGFWDFFAPAVSTTAAVEPGVLAEAEAALLSAGREFVLFWVGVLPAFGGKFVPAFGSSLGAAQATKKNKRGAV